MRRVALLVLVFGACAGCIGDGGNAAQPGPTSVDDIADDPGPPAASADAQTSDPVAAAVAFVASTDHLMAHSSIGRREIFRKLVVPDQVAANADALERVAESMAATLDAPVIRLTWVEAPLTATLVDLSAGRATVDVWTLSVLGAPDAGPPQQVWRTVHVVLDLIDGVWLVADSSADSGPTPIVSDLALPANFDAFAEVAGWPAVVQGVGL